MMHSIPARVARALASAFAPALRRAVAATALVVPGAFAAGALAPRPAEAQWVTTFEQFYLPAKHNWVYRKYYPFADRLFNAFDYGHSILYEELYTKPNAPPARLEETQYNFLTRRVLPNPPRVPLEETAIEIQYSRLAPEAKQMFEWAHLLHRQAYDVLADERLTEVEKDREMARLLAYYKSRPDVKFSSVPKSMKLMQEQPYSLAFRKQYPKFNGLIWGYHWMQVGLYEPLVVGKTFDERQALSTAAVARFRQMLTDAPRTMPYQMPMTAAVAPEFARRYPEFAIIFDNLHSMHDVVSDILANDRVPRDRKRAEIVLAGRRYRDDTSYVMPVAAWRTMSREMGQENMGGPAVGFTPALPTPTVTYGAVMSHNDATGQMVAMQYGQMTGAHAGHTMGGASASGDAMPGMNMTGSDAAGSHMAEMDHGTPPAPDGPGGTTHVDHGGMPHEIAPAPGAPMMDMHMRLMADPVIRRRVMADTAMRRMMTETLRSMPAEHRAHLESMLRDGAPAPRPAPSHAPARTPARGPAPAASRRPPQRPSQARPATRAADPHAGHTVPSASPRSAPPRPPSRTAPAPVDHSTMGHGTAGTP